MRKKNIFDLYNEQHKDDGKATDKMPGEVTAEDVEPEQEAAQEPEQKQEETPALEQKKEPEQKQEPVQEKPEGGRENES